MILETWSNLNWRASTVDYSMFETLRQTKMLLLFSGPKIHEPWMLSTGIKIVRFHLFFRLYLNHCMRPIHIGLFIQKYFKSFRRLQMQLSVFQINLQACIQILLAFQRGVIKWTIKWLDNIFLFFWVVGKKNIILTTFKLSQGLSHSILFWCYSCSVYYSSSKCWKLELLRFWCAYLKRRRFWSRYLGSFKIKTLSFSGILLCYWSAQLNFRRL